MQKIRNGTKKQMSQARYDYKLRLGCRRLTYGSAEKGFF